MEAPVSVNKQTTLESNVFDQPALEPSGLKHRHLFRLVVAVPFFLSAALYLSLIFAVFSPLPIVYAFLRFGRIAGLVASLTNLALIIALSGRTNTAVFFIISVVAAVTMAECLKLKLKLEWNALICAGMMLFASAALLVSYSYKFQVNPIKRLDTFVGGVVDQLAERVEAYKASGAVSSKDLEKFLIDPEITKKNILYELPSAVTITFLIIVVSNLLLLLRLNFVGIRNLLKLAPGFFKKWRAPDHMVWPTIIAGFFLVIDVRVVSEIALNIFKVLMALYALQGLSITNYLFDVWGVKGFLRPLGYTVSVAILLPLVISMGFFDLWFNFREKIKAS